MSVRSFCISNNPLVRRHVPGCLFIEGNAWDVLTAARDRIHGGARLLTHPLYGNFRPHQHPFRSVILAEGPDTNLDYESLKLLEEALAVYRAYEGQFAVSGTPHDEDRSLVDYELIRLSLETYGLFRPRVEEADAATSHQERG